MNSMEIKDLTNDELLIVLKTVNGFLDYLDGILKESLETGETDE